MMTDHLLVGALFLVAFWALDPLRLNLDRIGLIKHIPLLLTGAAIALAATGAALFPRRPAGVGVGPISAWFWPLGVFASGVLAGSLYGRFFAGVENSFLNMGLCMFLAPALAWQVGASADPARWARNFFCAVGSVAACDGLLQWAHFAGQTYFHGSEFIVIPLAVYCWFGVAAQPARFLGTAFFLSLAVAAHKNTGYLLALFCIAYCAFWSIRGRYRSLRNPLARERQAGTAALVAIVLLVTGALFYGLRKLLLPTGNPEYRLHTYQKALGKFLDAPVFGNFFSGPATERFDLYQVMNSASNVLPTHSDPLDILANGGAVYSLLFVYGAWRLIRLMWQAIDHSAADGDRALLPGLHACLAIFISGCIVFSFNPVLTQPNSALLLWAAAGTGLGLALRARHASAQAAGRHRAAPAQARPMPRSRVY